MVNFVHRSPVDSYKEAIKVPSREVDDVIFPLLESAILSMGFTRRTENNSDVIFLPCPLGTFSNPSAKGKGKCVECPPGMLWSVHSRLYCVHAN